MTRAILVMYIVWAMILTSAGIYLFRKISNQSDPSSLVNHIKTLKEISDDYLKVP